MKVLLVNPYYVCPDMGYAGKPTIPLSLAYLAGFLESKDIPVKILDLFALKKPEEPCLEYLTAQIKKEKPDLVGLTSVTASIPAALQIIDHIKSHNPEIITVLGGAHPTYDYENILKTKKTIDFIVRGEGEQTLYELVQNFENNNDFSKIKGLAFIKNEKIKLTPNRPVIEDLDTLPFPARHLLNLKLYPPTGLLLSSRGCPYKCNYCVETTFWGYKPRFHSAKRAVDEMEHLMDDWGHERVAFLDSTFTASKKRVVEICNEMKNRGRKFKWGCYARIDTVTPDLLKEMRKAGCYGLCYGVETLSVEALKNIQKTKNPRRINNWKEQATKAIKWARDENLFVITSFILGLPGETKESLEKTLEFLMKMKNKPNQVSLQNFVAFPGTEFYINNEKYGINIVDGNYERYTCDFPVAMTNTLKMKDLIYFKNKWREELKKIPNLEVHI
jgi:anaerobic magnesium-protoporphyrin IX monomethyl ester cyclase